MKVVAAFYQFIHRDDSEAVRQQLLSACHNLGIVGTILLGAEGINGTVAGSRAAIDALQTLLANSGFLSLEYKESFAEQNPFDHLKIKIKPEIVTMKRPDVDPTQIVGTYVDAQEWNRLLNDPEVVVIDVRNDFEVEQGSFVNAINPKTQAFSDFPDFVARNLSPERHRKIAMSCTGGIRCEKASSLMKSMGFAEVYHLKGGILQYLHDTPKAESLWRGECFIFDKRRALDHDLEPKVP